MHILLHIFIYTIICFIHVYYNIYSTDSTVHVGYLYLQAYADDLYVNVYTYLGDQRQSLRLNKKPTQSAEPPEIPPVAKPAPVSDKKQKRTSKSTDVANEPAPESAKKAKGKATKNKVNVLLDEASAEAKRPVLKPIKAEWVHTC